MACPSRRSNMSRDAFHAMVEKAKEYIHAGDIFQVVPSQRFSLPFKLPPLSPLSRRCAASIRRRSCSSSTSATSRSSDRAPRSWCGCATTRSPSGRSPAPRRARRHAARRTSGWPRDLLSDPKELAEHLMLLDLGAQRRRPRRQDRHGQGHRAASTIEYYSHVMHIVSQRRGRDRATSTTRSTR